MIADVVAKRSRASSRRAFHPRWDIIFPLPNNSIIQGDSGIVENELADPVEARMDASPFSLKHD
jgi:hypothetical protein